MITYNKDTKTMTIVAKDTADFVISINNYVLDEGDRVYFTVNAELENPDYKIQKVITEFVNHKCVVRLSSADTDLPVGSYYYDVEVNTADGRVDTVLGPAKFKIVGGVKF